MTDALDLFPLSFAQQRLWLLDQLYPGNTAYAIPLGLFLEGDLQPGALAAAVDDLVARHETLRTTFMLDGQEAVQAIHPTGNARLEIEDGGECSTGGSPEAARARAAAALQALAGQAFDLATGPLLRARLLTFGPRQHALLLVLHHIIADGWSIGVLSAELAAFYNARVAGEDPQLPELAVQYADFSAWQRETLAGEHRAALVAYWRETLGTPPGGPAALALPTDFPRPERQGFRGGSVPVHLDPASLANLGALERQLGATRAMTLVALWAAFLARHCGQPEVVVGVPVAGRLRPELEPLIGFFVNTLPLRVSVTDDAPFTQLLATTRDAMVAALAHQELPFEQIVEVVDPPRELGRTPLFQTMLSFLNLPRAALPMAGLTVSALPFPGQGAKFDLTLTLGQEEDGGLSGSISGSLEYDADLFAAATATRLARRFEAWVARCLARPDLPLGQQALLDTTELAEVLAWGSGPQRTWAGPAEAPGDSFPARFAARARANPQALAARFPDTPGQPAYTYGQLLAEAEALARVLAAQGGAPGTRIAVCLERGPGLLVGLLAVQLCGAAYVPLDPLFPPERLEWMVSDAAPVLTLTEAALVPALPAAAHVRLLLEETGGLADGLAAVATSVATSVPTSLPAPADIAYVLYTSGSTGRPKGVQITHGALLNLLRSMAERPGFSAADRLLAITTVSFDISGLELYLPLLVGGSLSLAGRATAQDPERLARCLETEAATVLQATPATWRMLLATGWAGRPDLTALCGGEALTGDLAEALLPRVGRLWNMYGPTETTIWSSCLEVLPGPAQPPVLPVGEAIANTWLYVLGSNGQALPPGVVGELAIGGAGVAVGYLNRPELNAERFRPDPFHPGGRLYLTGDLARWEAGGKLAFLGRSDFQVKIRGYRIELGDIEAALGSHPAVQQAVVVAAPAQGTQSGGGIDAGLAAYLQWRADQPRDIPALRQWLGTRLPDYMVPGLWQVVDQFPLTPNGKVNRKALPPLTGEGPAASVGAGQGAAGDASPQGEVEIRVAEVWQAVLGRQGVRRHDDFFALGGHSLAAVSALMALRRGRGGQGPEAGGQSFDQAFSQLTLADLFTHPTPARLAAHLGRPGGAGQPSGIVHFGGPAQASPRIVLVPGAGGDSAYLAPLARQLGDRYPVLGLVAPGLDGSPPAPSLTALAEAYAQHLHQGLAPGPFVLVAHSLGSFAAHALASHWQDESRPLLGVVVLDTVAPVLASPPFEGDDYPGGESLRQELAAAVAHLAGDAAAAHLLDTTANTADAADSTDTADTTSDGWLAAAGRVLRTQGHGELADRLLPMARVYETGHRYTYRSAHPINAPIALFKAQERMDAPGRRASAELLAWLATPDWGWQRLTRSTLRVGEVPGDHLTLAAPIHGAPLAQAVESAIQEFLS